nr:MAG TPA: hypothetical protein [Caudoviricetes sp.]
MRFADSRRFLAAFLLLKYYFRQREQIKYYFKLYIYYFM